MFPENIASPKIRQVLTASSVGLLATALMLSWGYPAAALPQMEQKNSTINFTPSQSSWFATLTLFMSIPGSLVGASLCEWIGPRKLCLLLAPLQCISTMAMAIASWDKIIEAGMAEYLLIILRIIQGALNAVLQPCVYLYTYEICDNHIRGTMTSLLDVWSTIGFLLCFITGCFFSWTTIAWFLPLITYVPALLGLLFSPEAPLWLSRKGYEETAREILNKYRCSMSEVQENLSVGLSNRNKHVSHADCLRVLLEKPNALAILTSNVISIAKELTGFAVILIYMVHIFDAAGVGLDSKYSSVIVGTVRLICNCVSSTLIHNFRRKVLLVAGNSLAGLAAFALGLFFYLKNSGCDVSLISWLPLAGLALHMFASSSTIGPTTWTMSVEVLPSAVRSVGFGISLTSFSVIAFIISKFFVTLQLVIGMHGIFWFFASGSLLYMLIVIFFVPETYGLSLQGVEDYWKSVSLKKTTIVEEGYARY